MLPFLGEDLVGELLMILLMMDWQCQSIWENQLN